MLDDTADRIKRVSRRLFAQRGIDGVSVRDIVSAAGARNNGSVHYYFGSKEALVRELVADGAKLVDERRIQALTELEQSGKPVELRDVLQVLVMSTIAVDGDEDDHSYVRFITVLQMSHRKLFVEALENRWMVGFRRCHAHLKRLLPDIPEPLLKQRLTFLSLYLGAVIAEREANLDQRKRGNKWWGSRTAIDNLLDTAIALLSSPPSAATLAEAAQREQGGSGGLSDPAPINPLLFNADSM